MIRLLDLLAYVGQRIGKPPGWERVVRLLASPQSFRNCPNVCVTTDGVAFIAQPSLPLGWHIAMFGTYEPELRSVLRAVLKPGAVAIDVGANVGWHTVLMASLVGDVGRVLAIEANASVLQILRENIAINKFINVQTVECAAGPSAGEVIFWGPDGRDSASGDGHVVPAGEVGAGGQLHKVRSRSIDEIVVSSGVERVDLLKIDVEGYEWPVLQGAESTLGRLRPHVIFEYVREYAGRGGATPELLMHYFTQHGYRLFALRRNWAEHIASPTDWPESCDIWAVPHGHQNES